MTSLPAGGLRIGSGGCGTSPFTGQLDEITMADRAWTVAELQAPRTQEQPVASYVYDALSRRIATTLSNGTQTTYSYDPASQVTNILHQLTATSAQINKADYLYNGVGNRTSLTDRRGSQTFGYDNLDRLTSASHPLLGTPQNFAYDPVGNRTTGGTVVNAGNQLTADTNHTYQYDDNGNLTRKTLLATGNYTQYTYDVENRLTQVQEFAAGNPTAVTTSTYRYDGLGRRIEKVANGQTKRYVYGGEDILLEYDGANTLQAKYTHGPGIDAPIAVTKGADTFFYHQDGLGSVTDLSDAAGATAKSYSYDSYGNILESPGTLEQPYTFTGREFDAESGLSYYRARYYDPASGRFLQQDPGSAGINSARLPRHPLDLVSQYVYAADNPIQLIDSFGNEPQEPGGVGVEACKYYDDVARVNRCKYHPYAREYWRILSKTRAYGLWPQQEQSALFVKSSSLKIKKRASIAQRRHVTGRAVQQLRPLLRITRKCLPRMVSLSGASRLGGCQQEGREIGEKADNDSSRGMGVATPCCRLRSTGRALYIPDILSGRSR
ncbi:MAG: RHS repeat-associated core domain-containing protein [Nitrospira sp.]|nr:RHS repeat-associated core domain-containing protein [Nitrospira sp.]